MSRPCLWLVVLAFVSAGCATTYKVDPKLVSQFSPGAPPARTETDLYIIRGSNFVGGARDVWVAVNDKVVAALSNNSHVKIRVPSGINTLAIVQNLTGVAQTAIDNRHGETLFLSLNYVQGTFDSVERDLGISMVMKTKPVEPLAESRKNDGYDDILMNPARLGLGLMKPAASNLEPTADSGVLTMVRTTKLIGPVPFDIWRAGEYAGSLKAGEYIQWRLPPGKHTFVAKAERYSILEVDVQAGKQYFAQLDVGMGWNQAHIKLMPIDVNSKEAAKLTSLANLKGVEVDPAVVRSSQFAPRQAAARAILNDVGAKEAAGQLEKRSLTSTMGR